MIAEQFLWEYSLLLIAMFIAWKATMRMAMIKTEYAYPSSVFLFGGILSWRWHLFDLLNDLAYFGYFRSYEMFVVLIAIFLPVLIGYLAVLRKAQILGHTKTEGLSGQEERDAKKQKQPFFIEIFQGKYSPNEIGIVWLIVAIVLGLFIKGYRRELFDVGMMEVITVFEFLWHYLCLIGLMKTKASTARSVWTVIIILVAIFPIFLFKPFGY